MLTFYLSPRQGLARLILPVYSDTYLLVDECKLPRHENNARTCRRQNPFQWSNSAKRHFLPYMYIKGKTKCKMMNLLNTTVIKWLQQICIINQVLMHFPQYKLNYDIHIQTLTTVKPLSFPTNTVIGWKLKWQHALLVQTFNSWFTKYVIGTLSEQ